MLDLIRASAPLAPSLLLSLPLLHPHPSGIPSFSRRPFIAFSLRFSSFRTRGIHRVIRDSRIQRACTRCSNLIFMRTRPKGADNRGTSENRDSWFLDVGSVGTKNGFFFSFSGWILFVPPFSLVRYVSFDFDVSARKIYENLMYKLGFPFLNLLNH